jgi:hypothetical protein
MIKQRFTDLKFSKRAGVWTAAVAVLTAGGVAFALLMSQVTLTGSSITTGTTGLAISPDDANYSNTYTGFDFANIIPGSQPSQNEHFYLKNTGTMPLAIKLGINNVPDNPSGVDLSKVHVLLIPNTTHTHFDFTMQSLIDAGSQGVAIDSANNLPVGAKEEYTMQINMDADAVNGPNASLSNIDFVITGAATN